MTTTKRSTSEIIEKAVNKHGSLYDYTSSVRKGNILTNIKCNKHGLFDQVIQTHLMGHGCTKCGRERTHIALKAVNDSQRSSLHKFVNSSIVIHSNKYEYSKVKYVNCRTKVEIICPTHGSFSQTPSKHLNGIGCAQCSKRPKITTQDFITRSQQAHGKIYDYTKSVYINTITKVHIICAQHGSFYQRAENHFRYKQGCPLCKHEKASKRGIGIYNQHNLTNNVMGQLYCVQMKSDTEMYFKIGITKNDYRTRLKNHGCRVTLLAQKQGGLLDLFLLEQQILTQMSSYRFKYRPKNSNARRMGWTECFPEKHGKVLLNVVNKLL